MALTGEYNFKGITIPNAYIVVQRTWGGTKDGGLSALIRIYADEATRKSNEQDYLAEKNLQGVAPYVAGKDALATVYEFLQNHIVTEAKPEVVEDLTANPPVQAQPAVAEVKGEFYGFVAC